MESAPTAAARFITRLSELLRAEHRGQEEGIAVVSVDLSSEFRRFDQPTWIVFIDSSVMERRVKQDPSAWLSRVVTDIKGSHQRSELTPIVLCAEKHQLTLLKRALASQRVAKDQPLLAARDILAGKHPVKVLRSSLLADTLPELLSPYQISAAVPSSMFFGRQQTINALRRKRVHQFITGPRRIGKSSIAKQLDRDLGVLRRPLRLIGPQSEVKSCCYLDVSPVAKSSESVFGAILKGFNLAPRDYAAWGRTTSSRTARWERGEVIDEAKALGAIIRSEEGAMTIILDEVDGWLEREAATGWPALEALRAMTDNSQAKVVFVGYESLALFVNDHRFPFHGRGDSTRIGPLDAESIRALIVSPIQQLGLTLEPEQPLVDRLMRDSSGMPHLIQDICSELVKMSLPRRKSNRVITMSDVDAAIRMSEAMDIFSEPFPRSEFPLAEAIAGIVSMTKGIDAGITAGEIAEQCEEAHYVYSSNEFELAMRYLELRYILKPLDQARGRWTWTNELAQRRMRERLQAIDRKRWISDLIRRHQEGTWRERYKAFTN